MINNSHYKPQDLDELDLMIIREMEQDARVSYTVIASKLGTSPPTVRRRLNRLINQGIVTIATIPAYDTLGYRTSLVFGINASPGTLNSLADQLVSVSSIKYLWITAGRYDIMGVALYQSLDAYLKSFPEEIRDIPVNVRIETMLALTVIKSTWSHLNQDNSTVLASDLRSKPTRLDLSVIRELEKSPTASIQALSQKIGSSRPSVRSSLRKLISQGTVRVLCIPDLAAFGEVVQAITLVQVHPPSLSALTSTLKVYPFVRQIAITIGTYNCLIFTTFQNSEQMHDFLTQGLGNMPGVLHYENLLVIRVQKRSFGLVSEDLSGN